MLLLKRGIKLLSLISALVFSASAYAGLYGFTKTAIPQQHETLTSPPRHIINYRQKMRDLVSSLARYGKSRNHDFQVLIHEGQYLLEKSLWEYHREGYNQIRQTSKLVEDPSFLSQDIPEIDENEDQKGTIHSYSDLFDGIVINNHYCQNKPISNLVLDLRIPVISIEQCPDDESLDEAIIQSFTDKIAIYPFIYLSQAFKKIHRQLIINENADSTLQIKDAKNISFLINDASFSTPYQMLEEIRNSNYDIVVIHPIFHGEIPFTKDDIEAMKIKKNGAKRLILAIYNVSEISDNNYLWQKKWNKKHPDWIANPSFVSERSYITQYWNPEWKQLASRYFKSILDSGYDGVFLTGLENHSYFEYNKPLE